MVAELRDGWLTVPYNGPDIARVHIGVGTAGSVEWTPAFLDWVDGVRVAKIRPPETGGPVWLKANGVVVEDAGSIPGLAPAPAADGGEVRPRPSGRVQGRRRRR